MKGAFYDMKNYKTPLNELTRWEIMKKSQREASGTVENPGRWRKKKIYKAKDFNNVNFEELFTRDTFVWSSRVGDYIVTVSFEGAFSSLYNQVRSWKGSERWKRIDLKLLTKCLSKCMDEEDLYVDCTCPDFCLHEDTLIKCLDGENYTVKQLLQKFQNNEDIWVYSTDQNGDFKPGHVSDVWVSGYVHDMIRVTLDNDKEILTTPNHLYMLRNGEYARADSLIVGQSLMPLYFSYINGYEKVMLNSKPKSFVSVYKNVANCVLQDQINEAKIRSGENIISIHHKNFNKLDNSPSNLYPMGHQEHYKYHYQHIKDNPEQLSKFIQGGISYWSTPERRQIKSEQMHNSIRKFWDSMSEEERLIHNERSHAWQRTPEGHEKMSQARKHYWENLPDDVRKERAIRGGKQLNGENGELASQRIKAYWKNLSEEEYKLRCEQCRENAKHMKITERCIQARKENGRKRQKERLFNQGTEILNELLKNNLEINEQNYNKYRKKGYPHYDVIVRYGLLENFNHKVKKVETVYYKDPIPVYDISVDNYNNFYVSSGVVLHNCYRFAYWLTQADAKYGTPQNRPPKVRNVRNNKGGACKHVLAVLFGKYWVPAAAKAWLSYIKENPELAEELIWG